MDEQEMNEEEWKAANVKPEIPLDVQQSMGIEPEAEEKPAEEPEAEE